MAILENEMRRELEAAVREAGKKLLSFWPGGSIKEGLQITAKKDGSLVTQADFASNQILIEALTRLVPADGIYSEELPPKDGLASMERVWIIDPLDGTKSFIDGNDDFSILLALCLHDWPAYGVMYFPARNQFAWGAKGEGAFLEGRSMRVSTAEAPRAKSIYLRHLKLPPQDIFYDRWMDSGMAFLNVCHGIFDGIILKIVNHQEWDLAAPAVLLSESGATITNEKGEPVRFEKGPVKTKYFVVSNGKIHDQLLAMIPPE